MSVQPILAILVCVCLFGIFLFPSPIHAQSPQLKFGVIGDSSSDEYRADDNRGSGTYAATTLNWTELLVKKRNVDMGSWGTWGGSRRTGYKYNWARSGAKIADMVAAGQHTGIAAQIQSGEVTHVLFMGGGNDFATYNGTYAEIYNGTLSGSALQAKLDAIVTNVQTIINTVTAANPQGFFITTVGDMSALPMLAAQFPDATKRERVATAINSVNTRIRTIAGAKNVPVIDIQAFATTLMSQVNTSGNLVIGGESITLNSIGNEPHHFILSDGIHAGTVGTGIIANVLIGGMNATGNTGIMPFSDSELLLHAGITPSNPAATSTPTPTRTPSPSPSSSPAQPSHTPVPSVPSQTCMKSSIGTLACWDAWIREFRGTQPGLLSDFDDNQRITLRDFELWRRTRAPLGPFPTIIL